MFSLICAWTNVEQTIETPSHSLWCSSSRVLDRNPVEKFRELMQSLCPTCMILYQSQWDSACPVNEGTRKWVSCMQIWCTGSFSPICHLNLSLDAYFAHPVHEQGDVKSILPQSTLMTLCSSDAAFTTKKSIIMSNSWCQVEVLTLIFHSSSFIQAMTESSHLFMFFMITSQRSSNICGLMQPIVPTSAQMVLSWFLAEHSWILRTCQISKFHGHLCKVQALPSLRQLDQLKFLPLAISQSRIIVGHLS